MEYDILLEEDNIVDIDKFQSNTSNISTAVYGIVLSRVLHYGLESKIFSLIALSKTGMTIEEIIVNYPKFSKSRLLRFLNTATSADLLKKNDKRYFSPEENKKYYLQSSESNLTAFMNHLISSTSIQFNYLEDEICDIRENKDIDIFKELYDDKDKIISFLDAMWVIGYGDTQEIIKYYLFNNVDTIVDLGGGSGIFSILSLLNNKATRAFIFDLPQIEFYINNKIKEFNLADRLYFYPGNFFKDKYPKADLFSLGYICSDWDDEKCLFLMEKVFNSLEYGGKIIIMEKLFNKNMIEPFETAMMDLCMMVEANGRHRSYDEYKKMLNSVGFRNISLIRTSGEKHGIVGEKIEYER
ncbi:MAG: hypothetical protein KFW09_01725 [Oscillospiraceae bacterium]|nr:hypothetical protein [Oscillospiraceae bacterium]